MPFSPAAAWTERAEVMVDVSPVFSDYSYRMDFMDEPIANSSMTPVPYAGLTIPVGGLALGAQFVIPYARGGKGDRFGPQRYHSVDGSILTLEGDVMVAGSPQPGLTLGAGFRVARVTNSSLKSMDLGALLYGILGPEAEVPLLDPFFEGEQQLVGLSGTAVGFSLGGAYEFSSATSLHFAFRSGLVAPLAGDVIVLPSLDMTARIDGQVSTRLRLPAEANLCMRVEMGKVALLPEVSWVGWSSNKTLVADVQNLAVTSSDVLMVSVLDSYGISEAEFLDSLGAMSTPTGMRDVYGGALTLQWQVHDKVLLFGTGGYNTAAVQTEYLHPGNVDWATAVSGGGTRLVVSDGVAIGLSGHAWTGMTRRVDNSVYSLTNPPGSGTILPNANGSYRLGLYRAGLTLELFPKSSGS